MQNIENFSSVSNQTRTTDQWNKAVVVKLMPIYVILLIYLLLGITGNSVVLFIYQRKFKTYSEGRYFIPVLAVTDMLSCIVSSIGHASETLIPTIYTVDIACKIERYLRMITTAFAMFTLILIVVERYLKVCRPFGRQMSKQWKQIFIGLVVISGLLVSMPCFLFYGSAPKTTSDGMIVGRRCSSVSAGLPTWALAFNISLFTIATAELIFMSVLYFLICRVIFKSARLRAQMTKGDDSCTVSLCKETTSDGKQAVVETEKITLDINQSKQAYSGKGTGKRGNTDEQKQRNENKRESPNSRVTIVFLAITIAFGISFIPTISMMVLESTIADFWFTLSDQEYVGIMFLYTFYIFNNFINPFIYTVMDRKFKEEVKKMFFKLIYD